jgi:hypothetical protein
MENDFFSGLTANTTSKKKNNGKKGNKPVVLHLHYDIPREWIKFRPEIITPLLEIDELLAQIFFFVDLKTISVLMRVCKDWNEIILSSDFWRFLSVSWFPYNKILVQQAKGVAKIKFSRLRVKSEDAWLVLFKFALKSHKRKIRDAKAAIEKDKVYKSFCEHTIAPNCTHPREDFYVNISCWGDLEALCTRCMLTEFMVRET